MTETTENLDELEPLLQSTDPATVMKAVEQLTRSKGRRSTRMLAEFLRHAPEGLTATRAAIALESRKHPSCLPLIRETYSERPELAEDVIPILSALEDQESIPLLLSDLGRLIDGPARISALAFLVKCGEPLPLVKALIPVLTTQPVAGARDDSMWALDQCLSSANEKMLRTVAELARAHSPEAVALVAPYMPAESELERQAPLLARLLLDTLVAQELVELVPDSDDALVELLANAICEARSPKALIKDCERILMESQAIEEIYADGDDLRRVFSEITGAKP